MSIKPTKDKVLAANIELHTALAKVYNKDEPHWRPENVKKVKNKLSHIKEKTSGEKLLDLGCGTGFVINIAKELKFKEIHGFDITKAMTDQINTDYEDGKIFINLKDTAEIDCESDFFDVATAYTFLSHLDDLIPTLKQAFRCLKKGGVFYSDLDPNAAFWIDLNKLDETKPFDEYISREIKHTKNIDSVLQEKYNISPETYNVAEYQKTQSLGLSEEYLSQILKDVGFKNIEIRYEWFIGQGLLNNDKTLSDEDRKQYIETIDSFLRKTLPLSKNLFKYISFTAEK